MNGEKIPRLRTYLFVWLGLLGLLTLTLVSAYIPMGAFNTVVNFSVAVAKALLVMLFFMHLRESSGLTRLFAAAGFLWLALLVGLTLTDVLTRTVPPRPW